MEREIQIYRVRAVHSWGVRSRLPGYGQYTAGKRDPDYQGKESTQLGCEIQIIRVRTVHSWGVKSRLPGQGRYTAGE